MMQRLYRLLLLLSPREFRERFGEELLQTARSVQRDRPSFTNQCRAAIDAVATVAALHADLRAEARIDARQLVTKTRNSPMDSLLRDIRFAARGLVRTPSFTIFVVLTLALGIGANAAMYGIADKLLIRGPEHIADADNIARLFVTTHPKGINAFTTPSFGHVEFDALKGSTNVIDGIAQYAVNDRVEGRGADAQSVRVGMAAANFFPLLGVRPQLGRFFNEAENATSAPQHVIVLSYGSWQSQFGGKADVLGKQVVIDDEIYTVVGVTPRGFTGADLGHVDYWAPASIFGARITNDWTHAWDAQWLQGVVRIKQGVSREQVSRELTAAHRRAYVGDDKALAVGDVFVGDISASSDGSQSMDIRVLQWLSGVAILVLLIACANVANLLIARGVRRGREMAIRAALGANRFRIIRLLLLESLMLSVTGATVGTAIAYFVGSLARSSVFTYVEWTSSPVDVRVLAASIVIAGVTGMVIGLIPAWKISRPNLSNSLKSGVREGGGRHSYVRSGLTIAQAALSVTLLVGAGLFVKSLWQVRSLHLGIDADRVLTVGISRSNLRAGTDEAARNIERARRRNFLTSVLPDLAATPGVQHAAVAVGMPFGNRFSVKLRIPGIDSLPRLSTGGAS
ncbi:MAG: ABC transporter permease [Gemmatimonadaceae bacterium]